MDTEIPDESNSDLLILKLQQLLRETCEGVHKNLSRMYTHYTVGNNSNDSLRTEINIRRNESCLICIIFYCAVIDKYIRSKRLDIEAI